MKKLEDSDLTANSVIEALWMLSDEEKRAFLPNFFKTGKGEYGEGDKFMGVMVPNIRKVSTQYKNLPFQEIEILIKNQYHETRLCGLLILVHQFNKGSENERKLVYNFYLNNTKYINNWDLVDLTCKEIVGNYLIDKPRIPLYELAKSKSLWEQRIAIVSTYTFIKNNEFNDTIAISEQLLNHKHDLIHKAVGWMLREVGKKDKIVLCDFLDKYHKIMPRTMLRYSIEKFSPQEREHYMAK